jgi:hypothetical protein
VHGLDDRGDIGVGVAQKCFGLGVLPCRPEQRMPLVVHTVQKDGEQQTVVDVAGVEQGRPSG